MRALHPIYDGDQGPGYRFHLDLGSGFDLTNAAVVCYLTDSAGTNIASRPGVIYGAKSDRYVDILMRGKETDWDGAGKELFLIPRVYKAMASDRTAATNLLVNPSFDTGVGTVADSWTQGGTLSDMLYELKQDDPAPPVIFGKAQRSYATVGGATTAFLSQAPSVTLVPGDVVSGGVWYRAKVDTGGSVAGAEHYVQVHTGAELVQTAFPAADSDWTFVTATAPIATAASASAFKLANSDAKGYEIRYDDAFLFNGKWSVYHTDTYSLRVTPRPRPSKTNFTTANFIKGRGGFEQDSNADGIADGWSKTGSLTYAMERDPDHLNLAVDATGSGAQKVTVAASATDNLRLLYRGHFKDGETWTFKAYYKNSGVLTGSPAAGAFGLVLHTEEFDGAYETSTLGVADFALSSTAAYTAVSAPVTLTADHSVLVLDINLKTATGGDLWLDDALLRRTA